MVGSKVKNWPQFVQSLKSGDHGIFIIQKRMSGLERTQTFVKDDLEFTDNCYLDCSIFMDLDNAHQCGWVSRFHLNPVVNIGKGGGLVPFFRSV